MVGVKIKAPELYTATEIENASVKIDDRTPYVWEDILDGEDYFYFYPTMTSETTTSTITIEWEEGNTQVFTVNLGTTATLDAEPSVYVEGVSLNKETTNIVINQNETLTATITPEDASDKRLIWTSSDDSVATVDATGKVTAVSYGTAVITAKTKDGKFVDTCTINAIYPPIQVLNIIQNESVMDMAGIFSRQVSVILHPTGGSGTYTYDFEIYNGQNNTLVGSTQSSGLDPTVNGISITTRSKTMSYKIDYTVTDSVGNTKSGTTNINAYAE